MQVYSKENQGLSTSNLIGNPLNKGYGEKTVYGISYTKGSETNIIVTPIISCDGINWYEQTATTLTASQNIAIECNQSKYNSVYVRTTGSSNGTTNVIIQKLNQY